MPIQKMAWSFKSDLKPAEMLKRLNAAWSKPWTEGDSEHLGDYLGGRLTPEAVGRIYKVRDGYVVNLRFYSEKGDEAQQLIEAQTVLVSKVLPIVEARDVEAADPLE